MCFYWSLLCWFTDLLLERRFISWVLNCKFQLRLEQSLHIFRDSASLSQVSREDTRDLDAFLFIIVELIYWNLITKKILVEYRISKYRLRLDISLHIFAQRCCKKCLCNSAHVCKKLDFLILDVWDRIHKHSYANLTKIS